MAGGNKLQAPKQLFLAEKHEGRCDEGFGKPLVRGARAEEITEGKGVAVEARNPWEGRRKLCLQELRKERVG